VRSSFQSQQQLGEVTMVALLPGSACAGSCAGADTQDLAHLYHTHVLGSWLGRQCWDSAVTSFDLSLAEHIFHHVKLSCWRLRCDYSWHCQNQHCNFGDGLPLCLFGVGVETGYGLRSLLFYPTTHWQAETNSEFGHIHCCAEQGTLSFLYVAFGH
jgi:hypothetical protein